MMLLVIAHPFKKASTLTDSQSMLAEIFYIEYSQIDVDFQTLSVTFSLKRNEFLEQVQSVLQWMYVFNI